MQIDLLRDTVQKGFVLLPDETILAHPGFQSYLSKNLSSLPKQSIVLLQSIGSGSAGSSFMKVFASIPRGQSPLILAGYLKPVTSALTEKGATIPLAVLTCDPNKASVYAGMSTGKRHQTILVSNPFDCELVKPTTASQATISVPRSVTSGTPVQFDYYGTSKKAPPSLGTLVDTGWADGETDETGTEFPGSKGNVYRATQLKHAGGASGVIYLCQDPNLVIKHFKKDQLYTSEQEKMRMMCASSFSHPNCIWPLEMVSKKGRNGKIYKDVGYVMKCCPFSDLDCATNAKRFVPRFPKKDLLIEAIVQICDGFEYMLNSNVVNGDIKLVNIVYDDKKRIPYIVDFDAVQIDKYINRMATPGYIPPEVYAGAANHNGTYQFYRKKYSDYYAISVCIFTLILGIAFPYSEPGGGAAEDTVKQKLTFAGNFPFKGSAQTVRSNVHISAYVRWTHLPSFVRQAFIDTFDKSGAHYRPDERYGPGDWKRIMSAYLRMLRDPKSELARKDPEYYLETAPLRKKNGQDFCDIPLNTLDIKMVQEVKQSQSALNLDKAVQTLVRKMNLSNINVPSVVSGLRQSGKFKVSDDASFTLLANLPFLKTVECTAYKPG